MYDKVGNICEIDFSVPVLKMAIDVLFRHLRNSLLCLNQTLLVLSRDCVTKISHPKQNNIEALRENQIKW